MSMDKMETLNDLFEHEMKDTYDAELQIVDAMPNMIEAASSQDVKDHFRQHLEETKGQVARLEELFQSMDMEPEREHCDGMAGIIKDGNKVATAEGDPMVKDAALIGAAQKVEHYEISAYGTLRTFAETLGMGDVAEKLQTTLREERHTDRMLSKVAQQGINRRAAA